MPVKDHDLIKQFNRGNREAFNRLVKRYMNDTYNYYYSITQDPLDADELTQKVFVQVFKSLKKFRYEAAFSTYLYRIKVNTLNSYFSNNRWRSFLGLDQMPELETTDEDFDKKTLSVELWKAIEQLPKKQRSVISLRITDNLKFKEVGEILKISEDAAKNNYSHGIKSLQKIMGKKR